MSEKATTIESNFAMQVNRIVAKIQKIDPDVKINSSDLFVRNYKEFQLLQHFRADIRKKEDEAVRSFEKGLA